MTNQFIWIDPGPDPSDLPATYLDNCHWIITEATARKLCDGKLPKHGYMRYISYKGYRCMILRTRHLSLATGNLETAWAIMTTNTKSGGREQFNEGGDK